LLLLSLGGCLDGDCGWLHHDDVFILGGGCLCFLLRRLLWRGVLFRLLFFILALGLFLLSVMSRK
jgi:hypothetical protein